MAREKKAAKRGRPAKATTVSTKRKTVKTKKVSVQAKKPSPIGAADDLTIQIEKTITAVLKEVNKVKLTTEKEVEKLKKQEEKIKTKLLKAKEKKAEVTEKLASKRTQAVVNQLARIKETIQINNAEAKILKSQLAVSKEAMKEAKVMEKKYAAMLKALNKFEREWSTQADQPPAKPKTTKKAKTIKQTRKSKAKKQQKVNKANDQEEVIVVETEIAAQEVQIPKQEVVLDESQEAALEDAMV